MKISISAKRKTLNETEAILSVLLSSQEHTIKDLTAQRDNPSVSPLYHSMKGQIELTECILDYIKGNPAGLHILAGK